MYKGRNNRQVMVKGLSLFLFLLLLFPAHALSQDKKGIEGLIGDLRADKPLTRRDAAIQLGTAKDTRGVAPLLDALRDNDEGVRRATTKALGDIGDPSAVKPLGNMLEDPDEFVRVNALEALERIGGDEAVNLIIGALKNKNPLVRINACASLKRIGNKMAVPPLEAAAKSDTLSYVRFAAEQALLQFRGEVIAKTPEKVEKRRTVADEKEIKSLDDLARVAERIKREYGLVLDYKKYDIMDLLDIEARMRMRYSGDTLESLLGDLLTPEDKVRNRHLFELKQ